MDKDPVKKYGNGNYAVIYVSKYSVLFLTYLECGIHAVNIDMK